MKLLAEPNSVGWKECGWSIVAASNSSWMWLMNWVRTNKTLWIPVTLVLVSGTLYRAIDTANDSLVTLTSVRALTVLIMVLGWLTARRKGAAKSVNTLWALMILSSMMLLVDTLILAVPESATISAGRQANRAALAANLFGYGLVMWLAVRFGSSSVWHAGFIVFGYAAVFEPTWPFLSPGLDEITFFAARLLSIAIAFIVVVLISIGFQSFDERTPGQQRPLVMALIATSVVRIIAENAPAAFFTLLPAIDAVIFGVGSYAIGNGAVMALTWLTMRSLGTRSPVTKR